MSIFNGLALAASQIAPQEFVRASDSGDTAWMLTATALVLLASSAGSGLWLAGQFRNGDESHGLARVGVVFVTASLAWIVAGYTLAFGDVSNGWLGGRNALMLAEIGNVRPGTNLPESAFVLFQLGLAILAPMLMLGAWAERARLGWMAVFCGLWVLVVYAPVTHWLWGGGWLATRVGALDYAGGLVINATAGFSALVVALFMGKRGQNQTTREPSAQNGGQFAGLSLVWLGMLAVNGGSAYAATDDASSAIINAHLAACAGATAWLLSRRLKKRDAKIVDGAKGALAGFAAVAAGAGYISPASTILTGVLAGLVCQSAAQVIGQRLGVDDSLDVFAVYGVGGVLGSLLLGFTISPGFGGLGYPPGMTLGSQMAAQAIAVAAICLWSIFASAILALAISLALPMRQDDEGPAATPSPDLNLR